MPDLFVVGAMLYVIFNWLFWGAILVGLGFSFTRLMRAQSFFAKGSDFFYAFWSGYSLLVFILMVEHYFLAMGYLALLAPIFIALWGFYTCRDYFVGFIKKVMSYARSHIIVSLFISILIFAYAGYARLGPVIFDTGKYHLQAVHWYSEYPVLYGLGNLCPYFAYNNSNFLFAALMEGTSLPQMSFHCMNTLLVLMFFLHLCVIVIGIVNNKKQTALTDWFVLVYAVLMFAFMFGKSRSITPALTIDIASVYIMKLLLEQAVCCCRVKSRNLFVIMIILCALIFTVKLSYSVQACCCVILGLLFIFRNNYFSWRVLLRYFSLTVLFFMVFFAPWVGRNIIMTGHLVFPAELTRLDLKWSVPTKDALKVYAEFKTWGRGFDCGNQADNINRTQFFNRPDAWKLPLFSMEWISVWYKLVWYNLLIFAFSFMLLLMQIIFSKKRKAIILCSITGIPWLFGCAFLFATAPCIRFLRASLFVFSAMAIALLIYNSAFLNRLFSRLAILIIPLILACGVIYYQKGVVDKEYYPGAVIKGFEEAPLTQVFGNKVIDGMSFFKINRQLWYAPLNSQPPSGLRLIKYGTFNEGFYKAN